MAYQNLFDLLQDIDDGLFSLNAACSYFNSMNVTSPDAIPEDVLKKLHDASIAKKWRKTLTEWWFELESEKREYIIAERAAQHPSIFKLLAPYKPEIANWITTRRQPKYYWQIFHLDAQPDDKMLRQILQTPIHTDERKMDVSRTQYERVLQHLDLAEQCAFWFRLGQTQTHKNINHVQDIIQRNKKRYPSSEGVLYNAAWSLGSFRLDTWNIDNARPEYECIAALPLDQRVQLLSLLRIESQLSAALKFKYNEEVRMNNPYKMNYWMTLITLGLSNEELEKISNLYDIAPTESIDDQSKIVATILKPQTPESDIGSFGLDF